MWAMWADSVVVLAVDPEEAGMDGRRAAPVRRIHGRALLQQLLHRPRVAVIRRHDQRRVREGGESSFLRRVRQTHPHNLLRRRVRLFLQAEVGMQHADRQRDPVVLPVVVDDLVVGAILCRSSTLFFLGHISPIFAPFFLVFSRFSPSRRQDSRKWRQKTGGWFRNGPKRPPKEWSPPTEREE